jgi:hypothetical protein
MNLQLLQTIASITMPILMFILAWRVGVSDKRSKKFHQEWICCRTCEIQLLKATGTLTEAAAKVVIEDHKLDKDDDLPGALRYYKQCKHEYANFDTKLKAEILPKGGK